MESEKTNKINVVICGGAAKPAIKLIPDHVKTNETVYYIGVDAGCLQLIKKGYELDYAVGDFDSVTKEEFKRIKDHSNHVIKHPAQKDDTDMELALEVAQKEYPNAIYHIFGAIGEQKGRLDHMLANIWMVYQPRFQSAVSQLRFIEKNHVFQFFNPGNHLISVHEKMPDYLSIISMTEVKGLKIEHAVYNLESSDFSYPRAFISNEFIDSTQPIHLSFDKGLVLVLWVNERN